MTLESALTVLFVGMAQGSFAFIIVKSPVFTSLKRRVIRRLDSTFFLKMISCPYCLGTWIAMPAALVCVLAGVQVFPVLNPISMIFTPFVIWLALTTVSGLFAGFLMNFYQFDSREESYPEVRRTL